MPSLRVKTSLCCLAASLLSFGLPSALAACCAVGPQGSEVLFGGQRNIIIWDKAAGVEHFIREASFESDSAQFGFIAPSPSVPEIASADRKAFGLLESLQPPPPPSLSCSAPTDAAIAKSADSVVVVQEVDAAGYKARTLKASDSAGLASYLKEQGFTSSPDFEKWLKHYVDKGWYLTSFIVTSKLGSQGTSPVRMSFKTDNPFNPYYVPKNNLVKGESAEPHNSQSSLKIYLISTDSLTTKVGGENGDPWRTPAWEAEMKAKDVSALAAALKIPLSSLANGAHLSFFQDWSFGRAETSEDIFFVPSWRIPKVMETIITIILSVFIALSIVKLFTHIRAAKSKQG